MSVFEPGGSMSQDPRAAVIAELTALANDFQASAASSALQAVIITYTKCAEHVEDRIRAVRSGDPLKF